MKTEDINESSAPRRTCYQCGRPLPEGFFFARICQAGEWLVFCRPGCLERYLTRERPELEVATTGWNS